MNFISPPYLSVESTTTAKLYAALQSAHEWATTMLKSFDAETLSEIKMPPLRPLRGLQDLQNQTLYVQTHLLRTLRHIRVGWDAIVRDYEDDWTGEQAKRCQLETVQIVVYLLNDAFTPHELREARRQSQADQETQRRKELQSALENGIFFNLSSPKGEDDVAEEEYEDEDD